VRLAAAALAVWLLEAAELAASSLATVELADWPEAARPQPMRSTEVRAAAAVLWS